MHYHNVHNLTILIVLIIISSYKALRSSVYTYVRSHTHGVLGHTMYVYVAKNIYVVETKSFKLLKLNTREHPILDLIVIVREAKCLKDSKKLMF